jgi:DNA-binding CsgD family transcriptional regulator
VSVLADRDPPLLAPLTLGERAAVGEHFFQRCCVGGLYATMALAGCAAIIALTNQRTVPSGTIVVAAAVIAAAARGLRAGGYDWLRRHPYALVLVGPLTAASSLWPAVDSNAVYFPALAPLMLIASVAQRRRERVAVIVSLAIGTAMAAVLDAGSPELSTASALASATVGVVIVGVLLGVVVDRCARRVLLEPDTLVPGPEPAPSGTPPTREHSETQGRRERIDAIGRASRDRLVRLRPTSLASLTARELQILFLVGEGLDHHDIADHLGISPRTVGKHVEHVRSKTGSILAGRPTSWLALQLPPFVAADDAPTENRDREPAP